MLIDISGRSDYSFALNSNTLQFKSVRIGLALTFLVMTLHANVFAEEKKQSFTDVIRNIFSGTEAAIVKTGEVTRQIASSTLYTVSGASDIQEYMNNPSEESAVPDQAMPAVLSEQGHFVESK